MRKIDKQGHYGAVIKSTHATLLLGSLPMADCISKNSPTISLIPYVILCTNVLGKWSLRHLLLDLGRLVTRGKVLVCDFQSQVTKQYSVWFSQAALCWNSRAMLWPSPHSPGNILGETHQDSGPLPQLIPADRLNHLATSVSKRSWNSFPASC